MRSAFEDRAHALGHDDDRGLVELAGERGAQARVGAEVERREAVVEDVDVRSLDERPRDGQALALPARDVGAALRDGRLEALRELAHEVARLGDLEGLPELLVRGVRVAVAQVARDRAAEEVGLLGHHADARPELLAIDLADVDAVDEHGAGGHVVEARQQVHERRLAAAGGAHDGRRLAGTRLEGDVAQDGLLGARVAEGHAAQLDVAARRGGPRRRGILDGGLGVEDLADAPARDDGPGDHDQHEGGHHDGHEDLHDVLR